MAFNKTFETKWIIGGIEADTIIFADELGKYLCALVPDRYDANKLVPDKNVSMTTSQIRNVFGEVKRIQAKGYEKQTSSFLLLKPKLAYAEARVVAKSKNSRIQDFRKIMDVAHTAVKNEKHFQNFVDFFEAVLAYHKSYGGNE